jgi:hypothetical protein
MERNGRPHSCARLLETQGHGQLAPILDGAPASERDLRNHRVADRLGGIIGAQDGKWPVLKIDRTDTLPDEDRAPRVRLAVTEEQIGQLFQPEVLLAR